MTKPPPDLLRVHLPDPPPSGGERALLPALVEWLIATGRLRTQTQLAYEVPWLGRRVDVATITSRGTTTAFELKIGGLQRALEQAAYNRAAFHRSWVVTPNRPRAEGVRLARSLGVGLLVVREDHVVPHAIAATRRPNPAAAVRLRRAITSRATARL